MRTGKQIASDMMDLSDEMSHHQRMCSIFYLFEQLDDTYKECVKTNQRFENEALHDAQS